VHTHIKKNKIPKNNNGFAQLERWESPLDTFSVVKVNQFTIFHEYA
jgi:hypothetical protein